jgi:hypothetical protein
MGNQKGGVMTFFKNIQEGFSSTEEKDLAAAQGTVPTILMIAGFAVVAISKHVVFHSRKALKQLMEVRERNVSVRTPPTVVQ